MKRSSRSSSGGLSSWPIYLLRLARPVMALYLLALLAFGYGLAHWDYAISLTGFGPFLLLQAGWLALHIGTIFLNACSDRDVGPVAMGETQVVRRGTRGIAFVALAGATAVGLSSSIQPGGLLLICVALACLYSRPSRPWKGHPILGPGVNLIGYGISTPLAGYLVVGLPLTVRSAVLILGISLSILGLYFLAQSYQEDEDRDRGYRTLVATRGTPAVILAAQACLRLSGLLFLSLIVVGFLPYLLALVLAPMWRMDRHLALWASHPSLHDMGKTNRVIKGYALLGLFTLLLLLGHHNWTVRTKGLYAGYGTRAGHPVPLMIKFRDHP